MQKDMRKSPEKICLVLDEGIWRWVLPNQVKYYPNAENIEYIRADLVEPSYGAEKIIRGNGKVQDEYILKSLHLKIKNDWFARGLKAGKISKNTSDCCCVIEDDEKTISRLCGAHKALCDKKMEDFKQLAETYRRILNAKGTKAEEV